MKHRRWNFYTWFIMGSIFALLWIAMEVDANHWNPLYWIDDFAGTIWDGLTKEGNQ